VPIEPLFRRKYANGCIIHNLDKVVRFLGGLEGVLVIGEATAI
jgi:hypothetical protein